MGAYTDARPFSAEGARIAVVTCLRCGTALTLDPADKISATEIHDQWHDALDDVLSAVFSREGE